MKTYDILYYKSDYSIIFIAKSLTMDFNSSGSITFAFGAPAKTHLATSRYGTLAVKITLPSDNSSIFCVGCHLISRIESARFPKILMCMIYNNLKKGAEKMDSMQQKWEKLTLADDFMFGKVMSDRKLCAEMLRRIFPDLDIGKIKIVETQKTLKQAIHVRGVRFDVLTTTARSIFDVEAQKRKLKDLHRRTRAYHIAVGYNALSKKSLKESGSYKDLLST